MHAPLPAAALFTPLPVSRTASPAPLPRRTPSKVERRLRDTLRRDRAASASRAATPVPVYAAHDVFIADCCEHDADHDDDNMAEYHLRRASSHRASPAPPSPSASSRHQRPPRSPMSAHRPSFSMSSAPVLRHPTPLRPAGVPAPSRSDPSSYGPASPPLMPHEVALRSRLQGVLDAQPKPSHPSSAARALRAVSGPNYAPSARRSHSRARSVSSRTDGDATWWAGPAPGFATQPTSPTTECSHSQRSPSLESLGFFPTPPSTPPSPSLALDQPPSASDRPSFDVRTASQLCRNAPGLVSFKDVEGLGAPLDMDELDAAEETADKSGRWWDLYAWSPFRRGSAEKPGVSSSA